MNLRQAASVGASWLALAGVALAQPATTTTAQSDAQAQRDQTIHELEDRLDALQQQLNDLKASTAADSSDIRRLQTTAPQVTLANGRPAIATADGNFKFALRGLFQFDAANYLQDTNLPSGAIQDLSSGANWRRARIGVEGTAFHDWNYAITYEAGGSGNEAPGLQQAYLEYAGWKPFGLTAPVRFRVGSYAVENTLEGATSNTDQVFLERPAVADLVRSTFGGDGRNAFGIYANGDRLYTSLVLTGGTISNADVTPQPAISATADAGSGGVNDEGWGYVARVGALALRSPDYTLHLGANYSTIVQFGDSEAGANTIQLRERPELRVDAQVGGTGGAASAQRLVDTGALAAASAQSYGLELAGQWQNFFLAGEWQHIDVDRTGTVRDPSFDGWYVQGAWTLTGERRTWNAANGGYNGIRVVNTFDPKQSHWGAWEIAARYSVLDLNDREGVAGAATPAGGVRGGEQDIASIGLNWYPNNTVRFLLDYQDVDVDRLNGAGAQIGQEYQAIALRTQVAF